MIITEGFHSIGLTTISFLLLPIVDLFHFIQISWTIACIPCVFEIIDVISNMKNTTYHSSLSWILKKIKRETFAKEYNICMTIFTLLLQLTGIVLICLQIESVKMTIVYVFSILFIWIRYWENFVEIPQTDKTIYKFSLRHVKISLHYSREKISFITHTWKIVVTFGTMVLLFTTHSDDSDNIFKALFGGESHFVFSGFQKDITIGKASYNTRSSIIIVTFVHMICGFIMYKAGKTACIIRCQIVGFYLPIMTAAALSDIFFQQLYAGQLSANFGIPEFDIFHWDVHVHSSDDNLLYIASILLYASTFILLTKYNLKHGYRQAKTARYVYDVFYWWSELSVQKVSRIKRQKTQLANSKGCKTH